MKGIDGKQWWSNEGGGLVRFIEFRKGPIEQAVWLTADVQKKKGGGGCARPAHVMSLVQVSW